jgi:hypothetical protein
MLQRPGWLLLLGLMLTAGVTMMHTVGHPDSAHGDLPVAQPIHMSGADHAVSDADQPLAHAAVALSATAVSMPGTAPNPMLICLAVLFAAFVIAVALVGRVRRAGRQALAANRYAPRDGPSRGPPGRWHGLILADLAVMRN